MLRGALLAVLMTTPAGAQARALLGWWRLDESAGTSLADAGPDGLDATVVGTVVLGGAGATAGTGLAIELDPLTPGYGSLPGSPAMQALTSDVSVAAWVRLDSLQGSYQRVFANDNGGWGAGFWNDRLLFTARGIQDYFGPAVKAAQWMHVVYVFDAGFDVTFYVDGAAVGSVVGSAPSAMPTPNWNLGALSAAGEFLDGRLDDVQVYEGALGAAQVQVLFQNPGFALGGRASVYCTGKLNSLGCTPALAFSGLPGASFGGPFDVRASSLRNQRPGLFFYSVGGMRTALPFRGGSLCLGGASLRRTPPVTAGGSLPPTLDCSGSIGLDFKAWFAGALGGNPDPAGGLPGALVHVQLWASDPGFAPPLDASLSDALEFEVGL